MSEDSTNRRANLARLIAGRNWTVTDLHEAMGGTAAGGRFSYWRDLVNDPKKSFGEKIARRIEEKLDLPRGWLDQVLERGVYQVRENEA